MKRWWVAVAALSLSACMTEHYKINRTEFVPTGPSTFTYKAGMDSNHDEALRMQVLAEYLRDNKLCPNGYRITERTPVVQETGPLVGDFGVVNYKGECTTAN